MTDVITGAALAVLRRLDPERAHGLALRALSMGMSPATRLLDDPTLGVAAMGLRFANPFGLAAGFDKDAVAVPALMRAGFGFVEVGTLTPRPQPGNPRPRLFRLAEHGAAINRLGFNNGGVDAALSRIARLRDRTVPLGINVGINKTGADPERDYPALLQAVAPHADYVVVNVSSPNTPGLRDLQDERRLDAILSAMAGVGARVPVLVKLAPDLADPSLAAVTEVALRHAVAGLIVSNTTLSRPGAVAGHRHAGEAGGLSGPPLFAASTRALAVVARTARRRLTLIGCGGIASGADALAKIRAGADLLQLYTAFAYEGPPLLRRLKRELAAEVRAAGWSSLAEAVGLDTERLAATEAVAA